MLVKKILAIGLIFLLAFSTACSIEKANGDGEISKKLGVQIQTNESEKQTAIDKEIESEKEELNTAIDFSPFVDKIVESDLTGKWYFAGYINIKITGKEYELIPSEDSYDESDSIELLSEGVIIGDNRLQAVSWKLLENRIMILGDYYALIVQNNALLVSTGYSNCLYIKEDDIKKLKGDVIVGNGSESPLYGYWIYNEYGSPNEDDLYVLLAFGAKNNKYMIAYTDGMGETIFYGNYCRIGDGFITDQGIVWRLCKNDSTNIENIELKPFWGKSGERVLLSNRNIEHDICTDIVSSGCSSYADLVETLKSCNNYSFAKSFPKFILYKYLNKAKSKTFTDNIDYAGMNEMPVIVATELLNNINDFKSSNYSVDVQIVQKKFSQLEINECINKYIEKNKDIILEEYGVIPNDVYEIEEAYLINGEVTNKSNYYHEELEDWWILKISGRYYVAIDCDFLNGLS